ncbi:Tet(A)/Tet(B)/Tet(C) family tetracycline efflux MFS transporter [Arsenicitalea aurantiaca]|uniref:Tet(A)/Tet(B)/Tet(C) family tetracycline efflux MFS transporter n=1 Tax=Arsenicitalea aurantiaca TaxID=1783274 RepID=A0A433XF48_9HYPH|nr:Tet(A)/Tet(B)/Tet(C) family tetracycline efflux MFS transporter [Arsenicitalea aurantiaca]RUT32692.1 Tet(A)/Tet(B)/Tet(C) family tetracycline efflux MFS transporter [Arsenicitalea aurantiaca]
MNKALVVILCAVTLDAIGIGLIFPILPSLLREVTHDAEIATLYGVMLALYAAMQFLFAPVLGMLSDRFGRRPVLLVSLFGAAIDYLIMAFAPELWMLVLGRAVAGITSANMAVAVAYITDITPEADRARRFGYFHAMFGVGFIIGPVLGGFLGEHWVRAPFIAAAILNALNFSLALFVLPESRPGKPGARLTLGVLNPFLPLVWALGFRALLPLLAIYIIMMLVGQVYGTVWVLFGEDHFGWSSFMIGLSLGAFGVFHAGAQAFLTGPVVARIGERAALIVGLAAEVAALIALGFAAGGWILFALMPLFAIGGVGMPALQSLTTAEVDADRQGQLQGVLASLVSLSAVFGPLLFSTVYFAVKASWPGAVWLIAAAIYTLAVPLMLTIRGRDPSSILRSSVGINADSSNQ